MAVFYVIAIAAGAYFLGGLNGAIITARLVYRDDIRAHGSGNAGLTNFHRTYGKRGMPLVLLIDVIKTALPVIVGGMLLESALTYGTVTDRIMIGRTLGGLFAMIGHAYPCLYKFKGGKGVLSGGTMALFVDIRIFLILLLIFAVTILLTRYVSLGSILVGIGFPVSYFVLDINMWATLLAVCAGVFVVYRHWENIQRLYKGEERKFSLSRKKEGGGS